MDKTLLERKGARRLLLLAIGLAGSCAIPGAARATLIAGDSYVVGGGAYSAGNLSAQPAATPVNSVGFSSAFTGFTSTYNASTTGLSYSAAGYSAPTGGSVQSTALTNGAVGSSTTPDFRNINRGLNSYTGANTYYFSALLQSTAALDSLQGFYVEFSNHTPTTYNNGLGSSATDRGFMFGLTGNGTTNAVTIQTASGTNDALVANTVATGLSGTATDLIIVRVNVNTSGAETFTAYVNPTNVSTEALAGSSASNVATETFTADALSTTTDISRFGFESFNNGATSPNVSADEVRFGTTFADVVGAVPTPEPSALGLVSVLGLGLLRRSRRGANAE